MFLVHICTIINLVGFSPMIKEGFLQSSFRLTALVATGLVILLIMIILPCPAADVSALNDTARWTCVNIPAGGEAGKWVLAPGSDVHCLAIAGDGTLYASMTGLPYTLYRSDDAGISWSHTGNVQDEIIAITISPHDYNSIYYATASDIYHSTDGGAHFQLIWPGPGGAGSDNIEITSIAVTWNGHEIVAAGTRDVDDNEFGDVYTYNEAGTASGVAATGIGDFDVYAVAFSPRYAFDYQLIAVVTDENDTFTASRSGSMAWNTLTDMTRLDRDNTGASVITATTAVIAFPDNYGSGTGPEDSVYYVGIDSGKNTGDVYKIDCYYSPAAIATDVNVGYAYGLNNLDISGLAAGGNYPDVSLLAGTADSAMVYFSPDGGGNWEITRKAPTGENDTRVVMAPGFAANGRAYAASSGVGSAFSVSRDYGNTWNQSGLIDATISTIIDIAPSPRYDNDGILFMITYGAGHSLWLSESGGLSWERILSTYTDGVDVLSQVTLPPQYSDPCLTIFIAGESNGQPAIWKSIDNGRDYRRHYSQDPVTNAPLAIDNLTAADENTLFVGGFNGSNGVVCKTINSGFFYSQIATAGGQPLYSLALSPDYEEDGIILAGNTDGWVYQSNDGGISFHPLPLDASLPPLSGSIAVAFDPEFATNDTVYAASDSPGSGIYRFVIGESTEWESIDGTLPDGALIRGLRVSANGVLYAANSKNEGGMERCLHPSVVSGAAFETITTGLSGDAALEGIWLSGGRLWSIDSANTLVLTLSDLLTKPVKLLTPEDGTAGAGNLIDNSVEKVELDWEASNGATDYRWQCDIDNDFTSVPEGLEGTTRASSVRLPSLEPSTTYYWRVRALSPMTSPWSAKATFTTTMSTETSLLKLEIPAAGDGGVPVRPVFQWTAGDGAIAYELMVSPNADFSNPVIFKKDDYALPGNAWRCDVRLDNDTTYYWKVRALGAETISAWSAVSIFTTEPLPADSDEEQSEAPSLPPMENTAGISPGTLSTQQSVTPPQMQIQPPSQPIQSSQPTSPSPPAAHSSVMPNWAIYMIGGLLLTVIFALIVIFTMVLKMKRF